MYHDSVFELNTFKITNVFILLIFQDLLVLFWLSDDKRTLPMIPNLHCVLKVLVSLTGTLRACHMKI